ncbi:MAG TPA: hypothetical protein VEU96_22130, partial [Bryobacteraceae bacterium]|nr:hypothetical protein [Bryobacteraceae bacterium]
MKRKGLTVSLGIMQGRWPVVVFPLIFFLQGLIFQQYPGIQNDELLFANPGSAVYRLNIANKEVPVMMLSYLGALKTLLFASFSSLFRPFFATVRVPILVVGGLTLVLFILLVEGAHGRRAA